MPIFNLSLRKEKDKELIEFLNALPSQVRSDWVRRACKAWMARRDPESIVRQTAMDILAEVRRLVQAEEPPASDDPFFREFGR